MYSLSDICSLCLVPNQNLTSIFSKDTDGTMIEEKLKVFLLEIVNFKPNIPKYICVYCLINLNKIYKFRQSCLENINTLNKYIQLDGHGPFKNVSITLTHTKQEPLELETMDYRETWEKKLQNDSLPCNTPKKTEFNEEHKHAYPENTNSILDYQKNSPEHVIVPEHVVVKTEYEEPEESSTEDEHENQTPYEEFQETDRQKHIVENKNSKTAFTTEKVKKKPKRIRNKGSPCKCPTCNKIFYRKNDLMKHERIHSGEKPYSCEMCHKTFKQQGHLTGHLRTHNNERQYKCSVCNKAFVEKCHLTIHMRIHTGEKPFHCHLCEYRSTASHQLKRHLKTHAG